MLKRLMNNRLIWSLAFLLAFWLIILFEQYVFSDSIARSQERLETRLVEDGMPLAQVAAIRGELYRAIEDVHTLMTLLFIMLSGIVGAAISMGGVRKSEDADNATAASIHPIEERGRDEFADG